MSETSVTCDTCRELRIATRRSRLALWQAEHVKARLQALHADLRVSLVPLSTRGDELLDGSLAGIGGKGLFVKELESALAEGRADIAVHSMKDVPAELPPGYVLAAILAREDPRDAFVSSRYDSFAALRAGAVVGTSSLRRQAQIAARHPALEIRPLRGNVDTRLAKLDRGEYAAIVLAAAGLKRLGLEARIRSTLEIEECLPAAGQGALGIECLEARADVMALVEALADAATSACVRAEREVNRALGGSCTIPLGAFAEMERGRLKLRALVASPRRQAHRARRERRRCRPAGSARVASRRAAARARRRRDSRLAGAMMPLAGKRVVVTRPSGQAGELARQIRDAGGEPVCIPAIEIRELADLAPFHAVADRLASFDLAIFVSRNAVRKGLELLRARRGSRSWPARLQVATIGQGGREELQAQGFSDVIAPPAQFDSEALLALPELAQVRGRRVVIFRGDGGRALLDETLAARGASVEVAPCYRRVRPQAGERIRSEWAQGVDAVTVSSTEGLANFLGMLEEGAARKMTGVPLFVPHPRVAEEAVRRGLGRAIVAGPRDAEMVAALVAYFGAAR